MEDFEKELKVCFLDEASQSVADVEQCFLSLEEDPNNTENINKIFRLAHNLKGSSKAVGFDAFGAFTHEFESFILKVKNGILKPSAKVVSLLLRANDHVAHMINGLKENLNATFDSDLLLNEMKNFSEDQGDTSSSTVAKGSAEDARTTEDSGTTADSSFTEEASASEDITNTDSNFAESVADTESILNFASTDVGEATGLQTKSVHLPTNSIETAGAVADERVLSKALFAEEKSEPKSSSSASAESLAASAVPSPKPAGKIGEGSGPKVSAAAEESIRVSLSKVENLINFVGEMVILQSVMREQALVTDSLLLRKTVQQLGKVSKEIQDVAMGLRMVPVKPTFQKMQRIVRDTAQALNKDVQIQLSGEETELDKTVLEKINDPLVHLIRNSVDHGIENAELRLSRGKNPKGIVDLRAFHHAGKLVIEVRDDGGGLDPEKLKKKAIEKGILKASANLTEKEALNLIFAPGFSTKEVVTDVSGRGVGMDVVRTNISELGGEILIESVVGKGTTFKIVLPLTLAIIDAMVITYSNERFVFPMNHVFETLQAHPNMIQTNTGLGDTLMLRGENMPIIRLGDFFGLKNSNLPHQMIAMVVRTSAKPFAILVDDIIGQFQVVIKQLGPELQNIKGVSGSTILGDGKPALIIEPQDLFKRKISNSFVPQQTSVGGRVA